MGDKPQCRESPLKIAIITHVFYPGVGGVEITTDVLARGFMSRHGAEVVVITNTSEKDDAREFPYPVLRRPSPRLFLETIRGADVVFHNNPAMSLWWPLALIRRPWMVTLRMWVTLPGQKLTLAQKIKYAFKYRMIERADVIAANSKALAGHVRGDVEVIPNSYRDGLFTVLDDEVRAPCGIVFLGRLSEDKGVDLLISATADLVQDNQELSLTIVGDGPDRERLERLAAESGLGTSVQFVGSKQPEESNRILNRNAIVVVPSRMPEPFGTVALEAAAAGCVVVYADHGGLPDAAGEHAVGFEPLDTASLRERLRALLRDPDNVALRRQLALAHAGHHREHVMVDRYYAAIERTLKTARNAENR